MKKALALASLVATVSGTAWAKLPSIPLRCAKSSGAVAERQYLDAPSGGGKIYVVNVTFVGKKPANPRIQRLFGNT